MKRDYYEFIIVIFTKGSAMDRDQREDVLGRGLHIIFKQQGVWADCTEQVKDSDSLGSVALTPAPE